MKNKTSITKMPISMTFNRIFPDFQDFQVWNQQFKLFRFLRPRTNPDFQRPLDKIMLLLRTYSAVFLCRSIASCETAGVLAGQY
jgi:hypothetical protein